MSKKPAFTGLWKCFRRVCLCNYEVYIPTARSIWDRLLGTPTTITGHLAGETSKEMLSKLTNAAEEQGRVTYETLILEHRKHLTQEREKGDYAFAARRKTIERIGLPQVRNFRLSLLGQEERAFQNRIEKRSQVYPEMVPLLVIRVEGDQHG